MAMLRRSVLVLVSLLLVGLGSLRADEGMWLLDQLEILPWKQMQKRGLKLKPEDIRRMSKAVVILDGGTAEFVSPNGLLLTNHHVAFGALQRVSTVEHNYIEEGFYAPTRADEIPVPGYSALVLQYYRDVTGRMLAGLSEDMDPQERFKTLERREKEIEDEIENSGTGIRASVVSMYSGLKYYLFVYKEYKDVRLVYAPPRSIGEYGGDIDNWMWPRHTGDFSFVRVYMSPQGEPADYSEDNVPYQPDYFFPISNQGAQENGFTFILGYPGRTYRYRSSHAIDYSVNLYYPERLRQFKLLIQILEDLSKESEDYAIKLSGFIKGLNNVLKNNQGMLDGFRRLKLLDKKKQMEEQFREFLKAHSELNAQYGTVLDEIGELYKQQYATARKDLWLGILRFVRLPSLVYTAYRFEKEMQKPKEQRDPDFDEKQIQRLIRRTRYSARQYVREADRRIMAAVLKELTSLPADQQPRLVQEILKRYPDASPEEAVTRYVDELFSKSSIKTLEDALGLFDRPLNELSQSTDPMLEYARLVYPDFEEQRQQNEAFAAKINQLRSRYIRALFAWKGEKLYPDANRTIRFTYGDVRGYRPRDAVLYLPRTTLSGVVEKHTGQEPFNAPAKLLDLARSKDYGAYMDPALKDVPVNFLHTTDITGGNSGSPVLNGKGELIGCAFDGNYEAITSDYQFDPEITRTISVDSRYILFVLDKFSNARELLNELHIVGKEVSGTGE